MQLPFVRWSGRIFLLYGLIISVLGLYAFHLHREKARQYEQYSADMYALNQAELIVESIRSAHNKDIKRTAEAYQRTVNKSILEHTHCIEKILQEMTLSITGEVSASYLTDKKRNDIVPFFTDVLLDTFRLKAFLQRRKSFADSLHSFAVYDSVKFREINNFFSPSRNAVAKEIQNRNRDDQKAVLLKIMLLNNMVAASQITAYLDSHTIQPRSSSPDYILPFIVYPESCIHVGEVFRCEVYLEAYSRKNDIIHMFVNDQPIPIVQGLGKFKQVYKTSGIKNIQPKIILVDAAVNDTIQISRDVQINICQ